MKWMIECMRVGVVGFLFLLFCQNNPATVERVIPEAPSDAGITAKTQSAIVTWSKPEKSLSFLVYRSTDQQSFPLVATTLDTFYVDTGLTPGAAYYYQVRCFDGDTLSRPSPVLTARIPETAGSYQVAIDRIFQNLPDLRELSFLRPIQTVVMTREAYARQVSGQISRSYTDEEDRAITRQLVQMGFMDDTTESFEESYSSFASDFAAAFYRSGTDSVFLIEPEDFEDGVLENYLLPHEFTHALQEQHFNPFSGYMWPPDDYSHYNSDFYLARRSVYEGDADFTALAYYVERDLYLDDPFGRALEVFEESKDEFFDSLKTHEKPRSYSIERKAPYVLGAYYVGKLRESQGWDAVNDQYLKNRATSSYEIITGQRITPKRWRFSELYSSILSQTQRPVYIDDDTYGPILLMALLTDHTDKTHAKKAFGWRGDRLLFVSDTDEKWGSLVWKIACSDSSTAVVLFSSLDQLITSRSLEGVTGNRSAVTADSIVYSYSGMFTTTLMRSDSTITWAENLPSDAEALALSDSALSGLAKAGSSGGYASFHTMDRTKKAHVVDFIVERSFQNQ